VSKQSQAAAGGGHEHVLPAQDVIDDIRFQFDPNYKSYLLYNDGGPSENVKRKKFR
jgi:hypothetical protein